MKTMCISLVGGAQLGAFQWSVWLTPMPNAPFRIPNFPGIITQNNKNSVMSLDSTVDP